MTIFILSVGEHIYSTNRLYREAKRRGHKVRVIDHTNCFVIVENNQQKIIYEGKNIANTPDVIIPRIGNTVGRHGQTIVNAFEYNGVKTMASAFGIRLAQSKIDSLQFLNKHQIPVPKTISAFNANAVDQQIDALGGTPIIIKLEEGTQGVGVMIAETKQSAKSIIETFHSLNSSFLLQEFIEESNGEDIRAFVIGDEVIASMKRKGSSNDFRSNIHRGGVGEKIELSEEQKNIAIKAAKEMGLTVAGVDMISSKKGALVLEVNATPGLQGIEFYTKANIAGAIIKHIEKNV